MSIPHFAFPLALNGGSFATHDQGTPQEIADCVEVLMLTPVGSRMVLPEYGAPEILFAQRPAVTPEWLAAVRRWEPRADVTLLEWGDIYDAKVEHIRAQVRGGA